MLQSEPVGFSSTPLTANSPLEIWTIQQVADYLQPSASSVYQLTRFRSNGTPRIPCRKVGRHLRSISHEVQEWFMSLQPHQNLRKRGYEAKEKAKGIDTKTTIALLSDRS
jgi:hypothetical protein